MSLSHQIVSKPSKLDQQRALRRTTSCEIEKPQIVVITTCARSTVYFVQDDNGRVKIGYAADPAARVGALQSANGGRLAVIRFIDGGPATERWLHRRFARRRLRGEWFAFDPEMMTVVPPDEVPQTIHVHQEPVRSLGFRARFAEAEDLGLTKPGLESTLLAFIGASLSADEVTGVLEWMRAQP
jgi:hypothetical protein